LKNALAPSLCPPKEKGLQMQAPYDNNH